MGEHLLAKFVTHDDDEANKVIAPHYILSLRISCAGVISSQLCGRLCENFLHYTSAVSIFPTQTGASLLLKPEDINL